jgi:hypothetical protein
MTTSSGHNRHRDGTEGSPAAQMTSGQDWWTRVMADVPLPQQAESEDSGARRRQLRANLALAQQVLCMARLWLTALQAGAESVQAFLEQPHMASSARPLADGNACHPTTPSGIPATGPRRSPDRWEGDGHSGPGHVRRGWDA